MNVTLARTFLEILEAGNLNKAAERLHVTQSTVTMRINSLESLLGQRLLVRNKSGVALTHAGFKFQRYAEMMVQIWNQARQDVALPKSFHAILTIGFEVDLWDGALDHWLAWLRSEVPGVALAAWAGDAERLGHWLGSGMIDVALTFGARLQSDQSSDKLFDDRLILVSREPRPLRRWDPGYIFVDWGEDFRRAHALAYPVEETAALTFGEGSLALRHVLSQGGSGYFPLRAVRTHLETGALSLVAGTPEFRVPIFLTRSAMMLLVDWFDAAVGALRSQGEQLWEVELETTMSPS